MDQVQIYRDIFLDHGAARLWKANAIIDRAIVIFSRITGMSYEASQILLLVIICYLIGLRILVKIHRKLFRRKVNAQKACTFEYDNILYLIAQEEYKNQGLASTSPIHELFNAKNKDYLKNHKLLVDAIRKLEAETKHILFTPEMEKKILKLRKKIIVADVIQKIFGILISLATAWIYLLFR